MTSPIISIENLGKCYRLRHQARRQRYVALRDVIADKTKSVACRLWSCMHGSSLVAKSKRPSNDKEQFWALKNVSAEVGQGDVVGIIGPNGAGKSTLLKLLSRITEPSEGRVTLRGRVASLLEVGTGFHPELTGRENIFLNGAVLGMSKAEIHNKFDQIVAFAEVEKFLDTPVKRYSSGMYVRLAFAVAAHLEPEILIVDEVLAVGDVEFQKKCLGKMQEVSKCGRTVLFVSHNMGAIAALCESGLLLQQGTVKASGSIHQCVQEYLHAKSFKSSRSLADCRLAQFKNERRRVEFTEITYETLDAQVRYGEKLTFLLKLHSDSGVANLSIGGSIFDATGAAIGTFFSKPCISVPAKRQTNVSVCLDLPELAPGQYSAGFSVGSGSEATNRMDYDVVIGMPFFEIIAVSASGAVGQWATSWGRLCLNQRVTVRATT